MGKKNKYLIDTETMGLTQHHKEFITLSDEIKKGVPISDITKFYPETPIKRCFDIHFIDSNKEMKVLPVIDLLALEMISKKA